jgi:trehalose/maltose hydrolase-like predicted phosphorylase
VPRGWCGSGWRPRWWRPADFTQQPYVGNGYLSQRLPAIGEGYQGNLGESGWPLNDQRFTGAFVSGAYSLSGSKEDIASIPTWSTLSVSVSRQKTIHERDHIAGTVDYVRQDKPNNFD